MSLKAVVFDMDGVLIDAREWHYQALNEALALFIEPIDPAEHAARFDGLPTQVKLEMLEAEGRLPRALFKIVGEVKQERTLRLAATFCRPRVDHLILIGWLKNLGLKIGVATNSIRLTTDAMLTWAGVRESMDIVLTNEDVAKPKPSPEIYLKAAERFGLSPEQLLVLEDNQNGIEAATAAGCTVYQVNNPDDLSIARFLNEGILWR